MIATFTDFGISGPYLGQLRAVFAEQAPGVAVVDLFPDLPAFNVRAAAYLLPAYSARLPRGSICLCVVDPGVGGERAVVAVEADGRWYVGPDNGLLSQVVRQAGSVAAFQIDWRPEWASSSFHGRDIFAPVCARLAARRELPEHRERSPDCLGRDWPADLWEVVYVDRYGNCMSGVRAARVPQDTVLEVAGHDCRYARTFCEAGPGQLFWYGNANGLLEIALAGGSAADQAALALGMPLVRR